jgi:VWFA-related protein
MSRQFALACVLVCAGWLTGTSAAQRPEFERLLDEYRGAGAENAIHALALWPESRVVREAVLPGSTTDLRTLAALALFHTETGLWNRTFGRPRADAGLVRSGPSAKEVHYRTAQTLIDRVMPAAERAKDADLVSFCRDWYVVANTFNGDIRGFGADIAALGRQKDHAELQMLVGASGAVQMGPQENDGPFSFGYGWGQREPGRAYAEPLIVAGRLTFLATRAREAENAFRRALKLDPGLSEARLRLGRLYHVLNRKKDATAEFERLLDAGDAAVDPFSRHLAPLFLGQIHEENGNLPGAVAAYARSAAADPLGATARLALGHALVASGRTDEAWAAMRAAFGEGPGPHLPQRDPWTYFPGTQDRRLDDRLARMRAAVSGTPRAPAPPDADAVTTVRGETGAAGIPSGDVRIDAIVTDNGEPVTGLGPSDFIVVDGVVRQSLKAVGQAGRLTVALVLDTSGSMRRGTDGPNFTRLTEPVVAALMPQDVVSIVSASDRLRLLADHVGDPSVIQSVIRHARIDEDAMTLTWDAVMASRALVANPAGRPIVVVISDGADNVSWFGRSRAVDALGRAGVAVDAIEVPFKLDAEGCRACARDFTYGPVTLRALEDATGGVVFGADDPDLAVRVKARFAALRLGYVLTYTPTNVGTGDGWHDVKVMLRPGVPGKIDARAGYYAPAK